MTINDYINSAIQRLKLDGQNALSRELNISTSYMANLKNGKKLPSENTMLKLAELAGVEKEKALIDLNLWCAKDDADRLAVWKRISKMLGCLSAISLILLSNHLAFSNILIDYTIYYVYLLTSMSLIFLYCKHVNKFLKPLNYAISTVYKENQKC